MEYSFSTPTFTRVTTFNDRGHWAGTILYRDKEGDIYIELPNGKAYSFTWVEKFRGGEQPLIDFLSGCHSSYLLGKLSNGSRTVDLEATVKRLKVSIIERRRELFKSLDADDRHRWEKKSYEARNKRAKEIARSCWRSLDDILNFDCSDANGYYLQLEHECGDLIRRLDDDWDELSPSMTYPPDLIFFIEKVFPGFLAQAKKQLPDTKNG